MTGVSAIRSTFLDFFRKEGHEVVPSSPLVPRNDPTLMFTNSGMVQFKNVFTGAEKRPYSRAVTAQKCVRAGGKHNDLDNVGYTARHHTFFEMLGNFSFGDYFKDRAIDLAWRLVTRELGLSPDRLTVTVFVDDDEAFGLWRKHRRPAREPHYPHRRPRTISGRWARPARAARAPRSSMIMASTLQAARPVRPQADGDRFIEIWNLVFMQFEQLTPAERIILPRPSIDTGMGLERIAAVLQGTHDNYQTDLFRSLIRAIEEETNTADEGTALRVAPGHRRPFARLLLPDRRWRLAVERGPRLCAAPHHAPRHAPCRAARGPRAADVEARPGAEAGDGRSLSRARSRRAADRRDAEARGEPVPPHPRARPAHARGGDRPRPRPGGMFSGQVAFRLYDTYGFPLDLTQDALKPRGITVDLDAFNQAMDEAAPGGAPHWAGSGEATTETLWFEIRERVGASEFLGYDTETAEGVVRAIVGDNGEERRSWTRGSPAAGAEPDAVLWRGRRPGRRSGHHPHRRRRPLPGDRYPEEARRPLSSISARSRRAASGSTNRSSSRSITSGGAASASITRRRICCTKRCGRCSATMSPRRDRWSSPIGCASISRTPRPSARRDRRVEDVANGWCRERRRDDAADVGRRSDRGGCPRAVRREIWR